VDLNAPAPEPGPAPEAAATPEEAEDWHPVEASAWPEPPSGQIWHGLAGEIVAKVAPHTEADALGLLAQLLVMFGNVIGRTAHVVVEETHHYTNEYAVLVGQSSLARKGTSADRIRRLLFPVDEAWVQSCIKAGLSSGEGLISAVRDEVWTKQPIKKGGEITGYQDVMIDAGVSDKRLLALEPEFGGVLRALEREGNKLSALLRQGWDHGDLATLTKSVFKATNAHVSIIGHITADELLALLSRTDMVNGLANRFLWFAVRRSQVLPFGGAAPNLGPLMDSLIKAADFGKALVGPMGWTDDARALWVSQYERLTNPPPGVLGAVTSRAAPHTLRLATLYAVLDRQPRIDADHLGAALALWDASARCAAFIFGDSLGSPDAEKIVAALRSAPHGLTRSEIREHVFQRNVSAARIKAALELLLRNNLIREERVETTRRPAYRYAINAINAKSPPHGTAYPREAPLNGVNGVNGVVPPTEPSAPQSAWKGVADGR
jgi:hypothetical protein